jgi:hypothetical protein
MKISENALFQSCKNAKQPIMQNTKFFLQIDRLGSGNLSRSATA